MENVNTVINDWVVDCFGAALYGTAAPKSLQRYLARAGYVVVPRHATAVMKVHGSKRLPDKSIDFAHDVYDTMISAWEDTAIRGEADHD